MPQGRTPFEQIALLLQGGGALGAYQAGVYEALAEADLHPDWVAGISIGAINSAIIAGNPPKSRVDALREFWRSRLTSPLGIPYFRHVELTTTPASVRQSSARLGVLLFGAPNFFRAAHAAAGVWPPGSADKASYYDNTPLQATLERLVDFDRINSGEMRFSVGAVDVRSGNFTYFDSTTHKIAFEHVAASGSLPPGFPATKIGDHYFWDGGLISNTPLQWVLDSAAAARHARVPDRSLECARRVAEGHDRGRGAAEGNHLFKPQSRGDRPISIYAEAADRGRKSTQADARGVARQRRCQALWSAEADDKVCNIVHLIYRARAL